MSERPRYYKLAGRKPVPATPEEASALIRDAEARTVARGVIGDSEVYTRFLAFDPAPHLPEAELFETVVQRGAHIRMTRRYVTWEEAEAGHVQVCAIVRGALSQQVAEAE